MNAISAQLLQIVDTLTPVLRACPEAQVREAPDNEGWSKKQILGHLIDSAVNNHQRFVRTLIEAPVSIPPYQQEMWVRLQGYQDQDWCLIVDLWSAYNRHIAYFIEQIPVADLTRECQIGENPPVSLGWLIQDYLRHLKHHLRQVIDQPEFEHLLSPGDRPG